MSNDGVGYIWLPNWDNYAETTVVTCPSISWGGGGELKIELFVILKKVVGFPARQTNDSFFDFFFQIFCSQLY